MANLRDDPQPKQATGTLFNPRLRTGTPTMAGGSQSSRPTKRFRSTGPDDLPPSPIVPQTAPHRRTLPFGNASPQKKNSASSRPFQPEPAPHAPMAPMAMMDTPATLSESPAAEEISVLVEEPAPVSTPAASLFGFGSKLVNVFTGSKAPPSPSRAPAAGRKRSIDEVEDAVVAAVVKEAKKLPAEDGEPENGEPAPPKEPKEPGNDTAVELENQLQGTTTIVADAQTDAPAQSSPAVTNRSQSVGNGLGTPIKAADAPEPRKTATPSPKAIKAAKAAEAKAAKASEAKAAKASAPKATQSSEPTPRRGRGRPRKSIVTESAPAAPTDKSPTAPETETAADEDKGEDKDDEFVIEKIVDHRHNAEDPTLLDVSVSWKTDLAAGEYTWEPEANVQEDAPDVLFKYWRTVKGGRASVLKDPDMWHVLRVEKHQIVQGTDEVVLHVAWIGSAQRSWEPEEAVAGYAEEHLQEYWAGLGGREAALGPIAPAAAPAAAPKRRGRPPKATSAASAAAKKGIANKAAPKAPAKKAAAATAGTKRQKKEAPSASTRSTRSSRH